MMNRNFSAVRVIGGLRAAFLAAVAAFVVAGLGIAAGTPAEAQDLVLRFAPVSGTQYQYTLEQRQVADIDLGALGNQRITNSSRMDFSLTGLSRAENGASELALKFGRVVMSASQGENVIFSIDTDKAEPSAMAGGGTTAAIGDATGEVMKAMLGIELAISFSPRGEILGVEGFEEMWQHLEESVGKDDVQAQQLFTALKEGFSGESMVQQMRTGFPVFPEGAVSVGDSWQDEVETQNPIMGEFSMVSTYTVGADKTVQGRKCREIAVDIAVEIRGASGMVEQLKQMLGGELDMAFDKLESSGTMCVDYTTGLPWASDMDNRMGMTLSVTQAGDAAQKMTMHMSLGGNVTMNQVATEKVE